MRDCVEPLSQASLNSVFQSFRVILKDFFVHFRQRKPRKRRAVSPMMRWR